MCQPILTISPEGTIHTWLKAVRAGTLDIGDGAHTPESAMSLAEE